MPVPASMSLMALSYIWSQDVVSRLTLMPVTFSNCWASGPAAYFEGWLDSVTPCSVFPVRFIDLAASANHCSPAPAAAGALVGAAAGALVGAAGGALVGAAAGAVVGAAAGAVVGAA